MITSYADMRSLATKSSVLSSMEYKSRTFPEATLGNLPWMSMFTIASEDILVGVVVGLLVLTLLRNVVHARVFYARGWRHGVAGACGAGGSTGVTCKRRAALGSRHKELHASSTPALVGLYLVQIWVIS